MFKCTVVRLLAELVTIGRKIEEKMNAFGSTMDRIDKATNGIAANLKALRDQLSAGMSPDEVKAAQDRLSAEADKLEGIGADSSNPVPPGTDTTGGGGGVDTTTGGGGTDTVAGA